MKIKKLIQIRCAGLLATAPLYFFAENAVSTNEHVVFFGDSLVDTGDYPEPSNVNDPDLMNFNLYVPITNPINVSDDDFRMFLTSSLGVPGGQGEINNEEKVQFSENWPLLSLQQP